VKVWVNGHLLDQESALVSIFDHAFTVGDGVFETLKTIENVPFALTRHLDRLTKSAKGLRLPEPDPAKIREAVLAVLEATPISGVGRLRITWTAGVGPSGSGRDSTSVPALVVTHIAATPWPAAARIVTVDFPRNERSPLAGIKSTSYAENVLALDLARERGAQEAIFANTRGELCEGTGSNIFVVVGDELLTPPLSSGCLAGVTRGLALEWCGAREVAMPMSVLLEADEILLASTTRDLQSVSQVNGRIMPPRTERGITASETFALQASSRMDP